MTAKKYLPGQLREDFLRGNGYFNQWGDWIDGEPDNDIERKRIERERIQAKTEASLRAAFRSLMFGYND
jgi:hypothetical protein